MKQPAIQFYTGDWFKDAELSLCGAATRGIWIDFILRMHDRDRCGQLVGTRKGLAQLGRCTEAELDAALAELSLSEAAIVTERHGQITVTNRRMRRDWEERQAAAKRAKNYRNRHNLPEDGGESREDNAGSYSENNASVTGELRSISSSSSSSSSSKERDERAREDDSNPEIPRLPVRSQEAVALASQERMQAGATQADRDRALEVARLYPDKAPKDGRPISFNPHALNVLAARIAKDRAYPWEEHAKLMRTVPTPQDGLRWAEEMPNPIGLEKLRKAAEPAVHERQRL